MPDFEWLRDRAREMRRHPTPAEKVFWRALRAGKMHGLKFRRQVPIGNYIVDFCCHAAKVIVEFDGDSHLGREERDLERKAWLEGQGYRVLRFGSEIVHWSDAEILGEVYLACRGTLVDPLNE